MQVKRKAEKGEIKSFPANVEGVVSCRPCQTQRNDVSISEFF
jgi:hypothetical protein